ncbi:hypothetical protein CHISP_0380 [Chitinispirillum alkaliphilum]|nr:hypothetical protein CHISP_0380 [Chitinispirillum alkaliphilum]
MIVETTQESGSEDPVRFWYEGSPLEVLEIEDRWYSSGVVYFKVFADNAKHYILMHNSHNDLWGGKEVQI